MNIYIASKFQNKKGFNALKKRLEEAGHVITHDWTKEDAEKVPSEQRPLYLMRCAIRDFEGVAKANVLVLLARPRMAGAFTEMGIAMGMSIPVIVLDGFKKGNPDNIFYHLPACGKFQHLKDVETLLHVLAQPPSKELFTKVPPIVKPSDTVIVNGQVPFNN